MKAPYNPRRTIREDHFWPFGHCDTCKKPTMVNCGCCGQCAEEANRGSCR